MNPAEEPEYLLAVCWVAVAVVSLCYPCVYLCCWSRQEGEEENTAALERPAMVLEQARRLAATMPVVKKELGYFPYSAAVEASAPGERQLECPICLEAFVHGAACGEVPACRHLFHRESEPLSAAEDMV
ncbi:hypothetical protein QYE76_015249 [Lolium multiflorum]|uniref:RING-type domain-containing protein n=1 Tax=Lolium multiflorum TaxID=4521 RepID=A0AAD8X917_LOLMU|nr:hypothetical protein QYE76_015130 [Lolium multiflorum]KAK1698552.1 hypothetical protein QYE76_015249 [Lolium multiflorum]